MMNHARRGGSHIILRSGSAYHVLCQITLPLCLKKENVESISFSREAGSSAHYNALAARPARVFIGRLPQGLRVSRRRLRCRVRAARALQWRQSVHHWTLGSIDARCRDALPTPSEGCHRQ